MARLNIRLSERKKDELKQQAEQEGKSMSGAIKEMVDEYIGHTPTDKLPAEDDLAQAYQTLWTMSDGRQIDVDTVEAKVADDLNTPKQGVRRRIMGQLKQRGYINLITRIEGAYYYPLVELDDRRQQRREQRRRRAEIMANDEMAELDTAEVTNESEAEA